MTLEQMQEMMLKMQAEMQALAARNAELEAKAKGEKKPFVPFCKLSEHKDGVISFYTGTSKFPVSMHRPAWLCLLANADVIRDFIDANKPALDAAEAAHNADKAARKAEKAATKPVVIPTPIQTVQNAPIAATNAQTIAARIVQNARIAPVTNGRRF